MRGRDEAWIADGALHRLDLTSRRLVVERAGDEAAAVAYLPRLDRLLTLDRSATHLSVLDPIDLHVERIVELPADAAPP